MHRLAWTLCLAFASLAGSGCRTQLDPYSWYNAPPGHQERQIQRFDPYPDTDIGPEMEGVRPRDFRSPVTEPARARWLRGGASFPRRAVQPAYGG